MAEQRLYGWLSLLFFGAVAVAVVETIVFTLVVLISTILGLRLDIELGPVTFALQQRSCCGPGVVVFNAATIGSFLFTASCGAGAALSRYRHWRRLA